MHHRLLTCARSARCLFHPYQIELMDATRERMVGRKEWSIFQLLQEEADRKMRGRERWRERGYGETEEEREQLVPIR